jgi:hypothetical protein
VTRDVTMYRSAAPSPAELARDGRCLFRRLSKGGIDFAPTLFTPTSGAARLDAARLAPLCGKDSRLWIKRGDVHAERTGDAVSIAPSAIEATLRAFASRGIPWVAAQKHVPGPVVRFHAASGGRVVRWYGVEAGPNGARPRADERAIARLVLDAAARVGLEMFGGDLVLPNPERPVLVDLDDWPSFAGLRDEAAAALAGITEERVSAG